VIIHHTKSHKKQIVHIDRLAPCSLPHQAQKLQQETQKNQPLPTQSSTKLATTLPPSGAFSKQATSPAGTPNQAFSSQHQHSKSGLARFCCQWFKPSWQKQVSTTFLPKHNKCSNILDKSTHCFAEHTQTGHHLLSIQPGLM